MGAITNENYYKIIDKLGRSLLTQSLRKGADFVDKHTKNGKTWAEYFDTRSDVVRRFIDNYFDELETYIKDVVSQGKSTRRYGFEREANRVKKQRNITTDLRTVRAFDTTKKPVQKSTGKQPRQNNKPVEPTKKGTLKVAKVTTEIYFISRFIDMHKKEKTYIQILSFINDLQTAIAEKEIRKTSKYANEILIIQDELLILFNKLKRTTSVTFKISESHLNRLQSIVDTTQQRLSVRFVKSYINMQGKVITNKQATYLYNRVARAINSGQIKETDPYWYQLQLLLASLKAFVKKNTHQGTLIIPPKDLNGFSEFRTKRRNTTNPKNLNGLGGFDGLNGWENETENFDTTDHTVVNSLDILNMKFEKLGFKGKWLSLIGDPSRGFTAMVFGKAKYGKSYLCLDFAGYLARNHGKVLYVAGEELIGDTVKRKLEDLGIAHPNLELTGTVPNDLSKWDFVFFDSSTRLGISPEDIANHKKMYPNISFIYIFHVTKQGIFRGNNGFQHDVDVIIEIPERGKAVQYGRFNQGGELYIFGKPLPPIESMELE